MHGFAVRINPATSRATETGTTVKKMIRKKAFPIEDSSCWSVKTRT
jgi:hypothetical protein